MSTTDVAADLASATPSEGFGAGPSELSDILETLGLEPEAAGTTEERTAAAVDKAARSTTGDAPKDKDAAKVDAKLTPEQQEDADFAVVRKRVDERRREREKGRRERDRPAQAAAPAVAAKPAETAPAKTDPPLNAAEKEAASALRSIVTEIAKMAEDDAPVGDAAKGERAKLIKSLEDKIAGIDAKLGDGTEARTKLAAAEKQIKELADRQAVERMIDTKLDELADSLPNLSSKRNAVGIVYRVAEKYFEKHGKAPSIKAIAELVEKKLTAETGTDPEKNPAASGKGKEKTTTPRKTVSSSLATPPAARTSPDKRTKDEAERDFYSALGIDPDA